MGHVSKFVKTMKAISLKNDSGLSTYHFEEKLALANINIKQDKYSDIRIDNIRNYGLETPHSDKGSFKIMFTDH